MRIIEKYENLKEYFLITLPTLPGFKGKNGVNQTERYQRIRNVLTSKAVLSPSPKDFKMMILLLGENCM